MKKQCNQHVLYKAGIQSEELQTEQAQAQIRLRSVFTDLPSSV